MVRSGAFMVALLLIRSTAAAQAVEVSDESSKDVRVDLQAEVPIPLTDEHDAANPGFGIRGAFGYDLGFILPTFDLGWAWTPLNDAGDRTLTRFHMGFGLQGEFDANKLLSIVVG